MAFSDQLTLRSIGDEMTRRFTSQYTGSDTIATAMHRVANHQPTGGPSADFEVPIGDFGGQSGIVEDLAVFADQTKNSGPQTASAIQVVRNFVSEVQRNDPT